ncbi:DUF2804 domain-containing protein [Arthrobacter sp. Helios]|uniref:DUF2804 domain-containing protein n=1 Tax=Arthrobacter sp. Helios TaxID=2828862 RepID=UPI0020571D4E|nr:DUF2804 domain-containing protein [Arthrobacter sp. Helios]UPO76772.1 DUF2804 domain-containing protein [Arthrobacter sp. Helios]
MEEIKEPVQLSRKNGTLNPAAAGFSRTALHGFTDLPSGLRHGWRTKRWEYWGVLTPELAVDMTIVHLDYAAALQLYVLERATGKEISYDPLTIPPGSTTILPNTPPPLTAVGTMGGTHLRFHDDDGGTHLRAAAERIGVELYAPAAGDVLGVVVPWSATRYQYTLKDVAREVSGTVTVDGREYLVGGPESFAVLDRGRGRWPYSKRWIWAAGSGTVDGTRLGLQLGGLWTDGTPATENALIVDGVLHHYDGELEFTYDLANPMAEWKVRGEWIDAVLTPFHRRRAATNAVLVSSKIWQAFGIWSGWAATPDGTRYQLDGLEGWVEEARNRW